MTKKIEEITLLTTRVDTLEAKVTTNIDVMIADLVYEVDRLKESDIHGIDKTLLRLLGTGGEWKILIDRVDVLEMKMFRLISSPNSESTPSMEDDEENIEGVDSDKSAS